MIQWRGSKGKVETNWAEGCDVHVIVLLDLWFKNNNFSIVLGFRRFIFVFKQTRNKVPSTQNVRGGGFDRNHRRHQHTPRYALHNHRYLCSQQSSWITRHTPRGGRTRHWAVPSSHADRKQSGAPPEVPSVDDRVFVFFGFSLRRFSVSFLTGSRSIHCVETRLQHKHTARVGPEDPAQTQSHCLSCSRARGWANVSLASSWVLLAGVSLC